MSEEIVIVHWPGKDTPACPDHLRKLVALAAVMGFQVSWSPAEFQPCPNCESEKLMAKGTVPRSDEEKSA